MGTFWGSSTCSRMTPFLAALASTLAADVNRQHELSDYELERYRQLEAKLEIRQKAAEALYEDAAERFVARVRDRYERHRRRLDVEHEIATLKDIYIRAAAEPDDIEDLDWRIGLLLFEAEDWSEDA